MFLLVLVCVFDNSKQDWFTQILDETRGIEQDLSTFSFALCGIKNKQTCLFFYWLIGLNIFQTFKK